MPKDIRIAPKDKDGNIIKDKAGNIIWEPATCKCGEVWDMYWGKKKNPDECYSCSFWREHLEHDLKEPQDVAIVKGHHYLIRPEPTPKTYRPTLGFGGEEFHIKFNDGRELITHNLWHQGEIPAYWKDKFPDNATFIE